MLGRRDPLRGVAGPLVSGVDDRRLERSSAYWENKGSKSILVKLFGLARIS